MRNTDGIVGMVKNGIYFKSIHHGRTNAGQKIRNVIGSHLEFEMDAISFRKTTRNVAFKTDSLVVEFLYFVLFSHHLSFFKNNDWLIKQLV